MSKRIGVCLVVFTIGLVPINPREVGAATIAAASCTSSNVQAAINSAAAGDTVNVPAGSCTWTSPVTIASKKLMLVGAGIGSTNITDNGTGDNPALDVTGASSINLVDVSGFTFIKQATHTDGIIQILGSDVHGVTSGVGFRFHNNRIFDNGVSGGRGISIFYVFGLIDHVTFDVTDKIASDQSVSVYGSNQGSDQGMSPWANFSLGLGTANAVYIEDCTFNYSNANDTAFDGYAGARIVARHNSITGNHFGTHGTDSGSARSTMLVELYQNTFTNNSGTNLNNFQSRGGVALLWDNIYGGPKGWAGIELSFYRECVADPSNYSTWQMANGTNWELGSTTFSDAAATTANITGSPQQILFRSGYRDHECIAGAPSNSDGSCSTYLDGSGIGGYPARDQIGVQPGQTVFGDYQWNNGNYTFTASGPNAICNGGLPLTTWARPNRDYFDYVSTGFNGTSGVGRGVSSNIPSSCTPGVAYFATDTGAQGTLYRCVSANTWSAAYVPYTYPHPLTQSQSLGANPPTAPTNLRITP